MKRIKDKEVMEFLNWGFEHSEEDIELSEFSTLILEYKAKFNHFPPTEPSSWSEEEWCEMLKMCIEANKDFYEFFGEQMIPDEGEDY